MENNDSNGFPGEYDPETDTYRIYYSEDMSEDVTTLIVKGVAAITNTSPIELDPIYDVLDPHAVNNLYPVDSQQAGGGADDHLTFTYHSCTVSVFNIGIIEIEPDADE